MREQDDTVATMDGGGETASTSLADSKDVFHVAVRFRPLNARERQEFFLQHNQVIEDNNNNNNYTNNNNNNNHNSHNYSDVDDEDEDEYDESAGGNATKTLLRIFSKRTFSFAGKAYTFDRVFDHQVSQQELYNELIGPLIRRFIEQPNDVTVIAYGQTSSGKTHSIHGMSTDTLVDQEAGQRGNVDSTVLALPAEAGILPRTIRDVFALNDSSANAIEFSFYEIYCEKIIDLLAMSCGGNGSGGGGGGAHEEIQLFDDRKTGKVFMRNLRWERVDTAAQLIKRLASTSEQRHYASTEMNANSSRSHTIFDMRLVPKRKGYNGGGGGMTNIGSTATAGSNIEFSTASAVALAASYKNCRIVDLAGSERVARTKAVGTTFDEGIKINRSLMDLSKVISEMSKPAGTTRTVNHRASKLTRILYGSFRGRSKVALLVCCSPSFDSQAETIGSLRFAEYAKRICLKLDDIKTPQTRREKTELARIRATEAARVEAERAARLLEDRMSALLSEASSREIEMEKLRQLVEQLQLHESTEKPSSTTTTTAATTTNPITMSTTATMTDTVVNDRLLHQTATDLGESTDSAASSASLSSASSAIPTMEVAVQASDTPLLVERAENVYNVQRPIDEESELMEQRNNYFDFAVEDLTFKAAMSGSKAIATDSPDRLVDTPQDDESQTKRLTEELKECHAINTRFARVLEKERDRNSRYRSVILALREKLYEQTSMNEVLYNEVNAVRKLKQMLLHDM